MSLDFKGGGVGGSILDDCHTLYVGKLWEELSKLVFSGEKDNG